VSSLSDFLGEIGRHQLLTPERELTMGRKVQEMVVLINSCLLLFLLSTISNWEKTADSYCT